MLLSSRTLLRSSCVAALTVMATGCDMSMDLDFSGTDTCAMGCGGWGYPTVPFEPLPTPVAGGMTFTSIAAGASHSCAVALSGTWCWGERNTGTPSYQYISRPELVAGSEGIATLSAGNSLTCGAKPDASVLCWGLSSAGEAGTGEIGPSWTPAPVKTTLALESISLAGVRHYGSAHACALTTDGIAYCWGDNMLGQLGDGTMKSSLVPVRVAGNHVFESISVGPQFTCGIVEGGAAWCWGQASEGQLGDDPLKADNCAAPGSGATLRCSTVPRPVAGDVKFTSITTGGGFACALNSEGRAYCWGANYLGQIGDGTSLWRPTPTRVFGTPRFTAIDAGTSTTCALTTGHDIMCWGSNGLGQLGDGTTEARNQPVKVASTAAFTTVSVGDDHTCALTVSGAAYCWGANDAMKLGKGS